MAKRNCSTCEGTGKVFRPDGFEDFTEEVCPCEDEEDQVEDSITTEETA